MNGQNDASIGINVKTDDRGIERLKQLFPTLERAVQSLKQTFGELGTFSQQRIGAAAQSTARLAGGFSNEDFTQFRQGQQRFLREARQFNKEQIRLIEERIQDERRAEEGRHRGALYAAGRDPRARAEEVDRHRWERSWIQNDRFRARVAEGRRYDTEVAGIQDLTPPFGPGGGEPGAGGGGGGGGGGRFAAGMAMARRGMLGTLGSLGVPLTVGAALYGGIRAGNEAVGEYDLVRRIGSYEDQNVTHFNTVRDRLLGVPGLSYAEAAHGMGAFVGQAGARPGMGREAMGLGIGFGIGGQAGAETFGSFARAGVTTDETSQRRFAEILGEHIIQAQMRGREGEVFRRLSEFLEASSRFSLGRPDTAGYFDLQMRLLNAAPDEQSRTSLRGGAGQAIFGAVHGAIAGTELFPNMGAGLLKPILYSIAGRRGMSPSQMQELVQSNPLSLLPEVLKHPIANAPGGMGDLMVSQMFGMPVEFARLLRRTPGAAGTIAGMSPGLQGALMNERDPRRIGMYMGAIADYQAGDRSPEARETLSARMTEISKGRPNTVEDYQEQQARLLNELNKLLTELTPAITTLSKMVADLSKTINDALAWWRGDKKPKYTEGRTKDDYAFPGPLAPIQPGQGPVTPDPYWEGLKEWSRGGSTGPLPPSQPGEGPTTPDPWWGKFKGWFKLPSWLKPSSSQGGGAGGGIVPVSYSGPASAMPPAPSSLARSKYGQLIAAWAKSSGYPEELAWATLMGESGATGTNAGTPVAAGDAGMSFGPMQLNARFFPTAMGMSEMENVWTGLQHLKKNLDAKGILGGMTGYMGKGPVAEARAKARLALAQYLTPSQAVAEASRGSSGVSSGWDEPTPTPTQGDRPAIAEDLARSFRVAVRVSIDPLSIIVRNAGGEVMDQLQVQPSIQWQGQSGPMTTEVAP